MTSSFAVGRRGAMVLLVLTALLWSSGGWLIKSVEWNPMAISGFRSLIAAIVIRLAFRTQQLTWSRDQIAGAVAYAITVTLFVIANKLTTAANAILLQYTAPVYVAILGAWLLKEKTTRLDWAAIGIVLGGMVLFFLDKVSVGGVAGNICALASGLSFATFIVFMRKQKDASPFGSVLIGNGLTFILGLPFMFDGGPAIASWWGLIFLGVFQLGMSYVVYTIAIPHVSALEAILIPVIEPVLNPFWVFLILGEIPGFWSVIGGVVILAAVTARCALAVLERRADTA